MIKITVHDHVVDEYHNGILLPITEMLLQGFSKESVAEILKPINFTEQEILRALIYNGGDDWRETSYLADTFDTWKLTQESK